LLLQNEKMELSEIDDPNNLIEIRSGWFGWKTTDVDTSKSG